MPGRVTGVFFELIEQELAQPCTSVNLLLCTSTQLAEKNTFHVSLGSKGKFDT